MHDDQLREQFTRWAQPLQQARPPALPVLRRRARRRTARTLALSGLAGVGVALAIVAAGFPWTGRAPAGPPTASSAPPYALTLDARHNGTATIWDMFTGKVLGRVAPPVAGSALVWVAAAADDRSFVLADELAATGVTQFYLLHLAASGTPGPLAPLDVPQLHGSQVYGLALSPDASKLAIAWQNDPTGPVINRISVTTLASGATRSWTSPAGSANSVSWAGDRLLAFSWQDEANPARSGVRLLDTTAAGTNPLASRLIIPASTRTATLSALGGSLISQDGSTVLSTMGAASGTKLAIVRFSARSGKLQAVLMKPVSPGQNPSYCGVLWSDPRGQHLITQCGTTQDEIEGIHATKIHLAQVIPASITGDANTFAW